MFVITLFLRGRLLTLRQFSKKWMNFGSYNSNDELDFERVLWCFPINNHQVPRTLKFAYIRPCFLYVPSMFVLST